MARFNFGAAGSQTAALTQSYRASVIIGQMVFYFSVIWIRSSAPTFFSWKLFLSNFRSCQGKYSNYSIPRHSISEHIQIPGNQCLGRVRFRLRIVMKALSFFPVFQTSQVLD